MLPSFHARGKEPTSQALVISSWGLLNRLSPPGFYNSAGISSPPGALPSFRPAIALTISSMVGISSRHVLAIRCGMLSRASCLCRQGRGVAFGSVHSILSQLSCCQRRPPFHMLISGEHVPSSWITHFLQFIVEVLHVVSAAARCSFTVFLSHQSDFSARVRFCSSLQASLLAAVVDLVLLVCNTLWWAWSLLLIRVGSSSLGSNEFCCFWLCYMRPAA